MNLTIARLSAAPQCESLPLEETARHVTAQLLAAGVGSRPVVFVCHSMGGLLVKEVSSDAIRVMFSCAGNDTTNVPRLD